MLWRQPKDIPLDLLPTGIYAVCKDGEYQFMRYTAEHLFCDMHGDRWYEPSEFDWIGEFNGPPVKQCFDCRYWFVPNSGDQYGSCIKVRHPTKRTDTCPDWAIGGSPR